MPFDARADMITFAEDWGRHPTSSQHLMRFLARDRRVIYVNSIVLRRPRLNLGDAGRVTRKVIDAVGGGWHGAPRNAPGGNGDDAMGPIDAAPENITFCAPRAVSWPGSRLVHQANRHLLGRQLRQVMAERAIERPILWTSLPTALPVVGELGERAVVYYCCDDFGSLVGVDHEPVVALEKRLVERADIVFAASEVLAERFPAGKTVFVPHGTDLDHFAVPVPRATDLPSGKKIAGFYGSIDDRLDLEMLAAAADQLPDWQFVLIGPIKTDLGAINGRGNVHLMGPRLYQDLPRYVQHWQVSMILYRYDDQVRAGNPLKMREYLAAGTPIVTIAVPALKPYRHLLSIAETPCGYAGAIEVAASDHARNDLRRAAVAGDGWQARAELIATHLDGVS